MKGCFMVDFGKWVTYHSTLQMSLFRNYMKMSIVACNNVYA